MDVQKLMAGLDALIKRTHPVNPLSTITIEVNMFGALRRFRACEVSKGVFTLQSGDIVQKRIINGMHTQWDVLRTDGLRTDWFSESRDTPPCWGEVHCVSLETFKKLGRLVEFSISDLKN